MDYTPYSHLRTQAPSYKRTCSLRCHSPWTDPFYSDIWHREIMISEEILGIRIRIGKYHSHRYSESRHADAQNCRGGWGMIIWKQKDKKTGLCERTAFLCMCCQGCYILYFSLFILATKSVLHFQENFGCHQVGGKIREVPKFRSYNLTTQLKLWDLYSAWAEDQFYFCFEIVTMHRVCY